MTELSQSCLEGLWHGLYFEARTAHYREDGGRIMKERESAFIPCGDSMEKMEEIRDAQMENVSGGAGDSERVFFSDSERFEPSNNIKELYKYPYVN